MELTADELRDRPVALAMAEAVAQPRRGRELLYVNSVQGAETEPTWTSFAVPAGIRSTANSPSAVAVGTDVYLVHRREVSQAGDRQHRGEQRRRNQLEVRRVREENRKAGTVQVLDSGEIDDEPAVSGRGPGECVPEGALLMSISPTAVTTGIPSGRWWVDRVSGVVMG